MTVSDMFSLAAALLASVGGGAAIVFALSNWLGKIWASRLMAIDEARYARELETLKTELSRIAEDRTRKVEKLMNHYERQIEEFYGPLFNMIEQIFVANHIQGEVLKIVRGKDAETETVRDYFQQHYFSPMHDEVRTILRSKLYLVEGAEMPQSFYLYLKHAAQERDQRTLWKEHKIDTSPLKGQQWPRDFENDIKSGFATAMNNYESCLDGLKK